MGRAVEDQGCNSPTVLTVTDQTHALAIQYPGLWHVHGFSMLAEGTSLCLLPFATVDKNSGVEAAAEQVVGERAALDRNRRR